MGTKTPKRILIAPLDWGLGHTARCVPIIRYILSLGHVPVIAGNNSQRHFIEETFGDIDFIHLEGYNVRYSKWNKWGQAGLLAQIPRIWKSIKAEHEWLRQAATKWQIDGVLSDNRYGLFHQSIPCVILTHQLQVQTGMGDVLNRMVKKMHYSYLGRFSETWVVDVNAHENLAGRLSHPARLPESCSYIGLLSQFDSCDASKTEMQGDYLLVLLSGPEPQRSELSRILWKQLLHYKGKAVFVEGSENAAAPDFIPPHITYYKRVTGKTLLPLLQGASMVISRSGYSTVMDLVALNKRAILTPTPGQTEQQYLAKYLMEKKVFYSCAQPGFSLEQALKGAVQFACEPTGLANCYDIYRETLRRWVDKL